ncbi:MAG: hypothetical protein A2498_13905 [Lentisphaerae bacterium RIFOXYC12_FULL_60_16]|nr:MAG: hypothetical protein A2498_13905 [Lentisphaerae bacterium RIFOXYC12_FULL_60_16]OGV75377.1 MAG: hypothetical protein A2340_05060 [Lentisphaerae bacterium RIFOXYB12_FULL_60_10]
MSVTMRIIQQYDIRNEQAFLDLERKFAALEAARPDYPKGRRMKPLAGSMPTNTLIWQCEFPDLNAAHKALSFFAGDAAHEALFKRQLPFFESARVEFYENLEYTP